MPCYPLAMPAPILPLLEAASLLPPRGALIGLDQGLTVGDRNLIIIWMDFAEGQEAVAVAAILDEGRLQ